MSTSAIRIKGKEIMYGKRHIDLVMDLLEREGYTEDFVDEMIESGQLEFGYFYIADNTWSTDEVRNCVYESIDRMIEINGRSTRL